MPTIINQNSKSATKKQMIQHRKTYNILNGECLKIFGGYGNNRQYLQFEGRMCVYCVKKGTGFDMVQGVFGFFGKVRTVFVYDNNARRQLIMCKKGQYTDVYGRAMLIAREIKIPSGKIVKRKEWAFMAYDINPHYVPKQVDIKKREEMIANNLEKDDLEALELDKEQAFKPIVDHLLSQHESEEELEEEYNYFGDSIYEKTSY